MILGDIFFFISIIYFSLRIGLNEILIIEFLMNSIF